MLYFPQPLWFSYAVFLFLRNIHTLNPHIEEKGIKMITDIFKDRILEQREAEKEEAEKIKKNAEELASVLEKAEQDIHKLLENASVSAFKIPAGANPAIIIKPFEHEEKGDFTKRYTVFTGYKKCFYADGAYEDEIVEVDKVGEITLTFSHVIHSVDFSNLFKSEGAVVKKDKNIYVTFENMKAE